MGEMNRIKSGGQCALLSLLSMLCHQRLGVGPFPVEPLNSLIDQ